LALDGCHASIFRRFSATARNLVRQAERKGVTVRPGRTAEDVARYYAIYKKVIGDRSSWNLIYPETMYLELLKIPDFGRFLVAELDHVIIGGGWFIRDGDSSLLWGCMMDYDYKDYSPSYAVINSGIESACAAGLKTFNMGASTGPSLEQFKAAWGARRSDYWMFTWRNPIWSSISTARSWFDGR
jgi:lipid II:glycine glycyltransferase (peptidoglycan interpeptide bridge formation enzyme)